MKFSSSSLSHVISTCRRKMWVYSKKSGSIYFIKNLVNSMKLNFRMLLWISVTEFSEFPCQRAENLHREKIKINRTTKSAHAKPRPILENGNVNKVSFEMKSKEVNPCVLRRNHGNMNGKVYLMLFSMNAPISLQCYFHFCFHVGAIANSCTTQFITKSH